MTLSRERPAFRVAIGGVSGRDHRRAHRDGQDGYAMVQATDLTAAIVTDGCSSGRSSEVGARLGAFWLAALIARTFALHAHEAEEAAHEVTSGLVLQLRATAGAFAAGDAIDPSVVHDLWLFGFLAAVVTREHAIVFGVGDGLVWIDGQATVIDPGPDNAPTYPAYALLGASIAPRILHLGPAADIAAIAVATDGAAELLEPGSDPSFDTLVGDARLLENPSLLRKRLVALSDRGRFWDDATVGIVRRSP
jgi:hypothetical protein